MIRNMAGYFSWERMDMAKRKSEKGVSSKISRKKQKGSKFVTREFRSFDEMDAFLRDRDKFRSGK